MGRAWPITLSRASVEPAGVRSEVQRSVGAAFERPLDASVGLLDTKVMLSPRVVFTTGMRCCYDIAIELA